MGGMGNFYEGSKDNDDYLSKVSLSLGIQCECSPNVESIITEL